MSRRQLSSAIRRPMSTGCPSNGAISDIVDAFLYLGGAWDRKNLRVDSGQCAGH